ncbi:MAG: hypothetical protein QNJ57_12970 [Flavobacteriaceae bacterium]|nr:hypothetical protein [Flavobacteriaceae bacterium]
MRNPTKTEIEEIKYYMSLPLDSLLIFIGQAVVEQHEGVQFSDEHLKNEGNSWFLKYKKRIKSEICVKWDFCEKLKSETYKDNVTLIASIGDIIAGIFIGVPPFVVSTLLVKSGLTKFCACP